MSTHQKPLVRWSRWGWMIQNDEPNGNAFEWIYRFSKWYLWSWLVCRCDDCGTYFDVMTLSWADLFLRFVQNALCAQRWLEEISKMFGFFSFVFFSWITSIVWIWYSVDWMMNIQRTLSRMSQRVIAHNACTMLDRIDEVLQNKRNTKRIKAMMKKKRRYYARSHLRFLRVARTHSRVRWTFFFVFVPLCSFGLCWIYWLLMNNGYLYLVDELFVGRSTSTMPMYCDSHPRLSNAKMPIFVIAAMNAKK